MSFLDDLFGMGDDTNPANAAMPYLDKIAPMEKEYYNPFITRGNAAYSKFNPQLDKMTSDPAGFLQSLMGAYTPSKSYQLKKDEMTRAAGNTAAAGGQRGSLEDITNQSRITDTLMGDDMQQWLQNVLGIHGRGLEGEQHLYDTGYDATKALTGDLSNVLGTQGSLAFQGQANRNQSHSDLLSALTKLGAAGAGYFMGGMPGVSAASKFF